MNPKPTRNQRRKAAREAARTDEPTPLTPAETVRRRRNRRMLLLGLIALAFPILEVVAYRFRAIHIIVTNQSDEVVTDVKVSFPGGTLTARELKPGADLAGVVRPDYSFAKNEFSTYRTEVIFATGQGRSRLILRAGTIDYSARETYSIEPEGPNKVLAIKHTTYPGFPLGTIRDLLARLGVG